MKTVFCSPDHDGWMVLHFDRELPLPPLGRSPIPSFRCPMCLSRTMRLHKAAAGMAVANRGRFVVEMADPRRHFLRFLEELLFLPGVERVIMEDRYRMCVRVGGLFPPAQVAQAVAGCVQRHFYPDEDVKVKPLPPEDFPRWLLEE